MRTMYRLLHSVVSVGIYFLLFLYLLPKFNFSSLLDILVIFAKVAVVCSQNEQKN